jgi:hypothetical protein
MELSYDDIIIIIMYPYIYTRFDFFFFFFFFEDTFHILLLILTALHDVTFSYGINLLQIMNSQIIYTIFI